MTPSSTFTPVTLPLSDFNALAQTDCLALVHSFLDVDSWARWLCGARPYGSIDDIVSTSAAAGAHLSAAEILGALERHPRIGDRLGDGSRESNWSDREQIGVAGDPEAAAELAVGNAVYEERFGFIYLVRAAGRSARELVELLHDRLDNDRDHEIGVVRAELLDIAEIRIRALMVT